MTTEQDSPREISALLALETYQDMTDEEIEIIISYKVDREIRRRLLAEDRALLTLEMETRIADNRESCRKSQAMLESILSKRPVLQSVGGENE